MDSEKLPCSIFWEASDWQQFHFGAWLWSQTHWMQWKHTWIQKHRAYRPQRDWNAFMCKLCFYLSLLYFCVLLHVFSQSLLKKKIIYLFMHAQLRISRRFKGRKENEAFSNVFNHEPLWPHEVWPPGNHCHEAHNHYKIKSSVCRTKSLFSLSFSQL